MDWLQIFTLITGILYIVFEIRQKNFMWVVGIATSSAAMWVFYRQGLYASFGLNTYYFITAFIGLWRWRLDKKTIASGREDSASVDDVIVLNRLSWKTVAVSTVACICGTVLLSSGMTFMYEAGFLKENPLSLLDAAVTVLSAVATWWLVRSYLEQWWLWIIADIMSTVLCAMQGMWWMTVLYLAYVVAAGYGFYYWRKRGIYLSE